MNRATSIEFLKNNRELWDVIVIGGGATGLGIAVDSSLRGYKTLLLEQSDFTKGTSSRSTKLLHGGVRYLAQKDIKLVFEALHERGLILKNAPHLSGNQSFVIPIYKNWKGFYYAFGLIIYDLLAGRLSLGKSEWIDAEEVMRLLPSVKKEGLKSGVLYHDGQFDDSRLGINLAQTCADLGGHLLNYVKVTGLLKSEAGKLSGVQAIDMETNFSYEIKSRSVINATGVFVDEVLLADNANNKPMVKPSQGTHIVLDKSFLPTDFALMIPETADGRVLFAIPWHDKVVVGTTDVMVDKAELEPHPKAEEVDFILNTFGQYLEKQPKRGDVLSVFCGLRPLAMPTEKGKKTKEISRNHKLIVSESNLVTITGGKWTTYRKMAQDTVDLVAQLAGLPKKQSSTENYKLHGYMQKPGNTWLHFYGSDEAQIRDLMKTESFAEILHPKYPIVKAEVIWSVRNEMARTVEDFLARRTRLLLLDARAAIDCAPVVAALMAKELNKGKDWIDEQIIKFEALAKSYLI